MIQLESLFEYVLDNENSCERFVGNVFLGLFFKILFVVNNWVL